MLADSSFYLCFLEDIDQPEVLLRILAKFDFLITPIVYKEVRRVRNSFFIVPIGKISLSKSGIVPIIPLIWCL